MIFLMDENLKNVLLEGSWSKKAHTYIYIIIINKHK